MRIRPAPEGLGDEGKKFWRASLRAYNLPDPEQLKILEDACTCRDEMAEAKKKIKEQSYYVDRWGQPREHPAHKILKDNAALFARLCRELGLTLDSDSQAQARGNRRY